MDEHGPGSKLMAVSALMDEEGLESPPAGGVGPIVRRPLQEEVAARLRDLITQGTIAPGTRINEVALCAKLGVSRTPLREAVRMLAGEGLVELVPARGAVVRKVTLKDVTDSLTVLRNLEGLAGELACREASGEGIARVVALHEAMMDRYAARDRMAYFKLNQAIHTAIVALSGNATLIWAHEAIQARMKHIRFIGNAGPEKWAGAVAEHEQMVAALKKRDGTALARVLQLHLDKTLERVRDQI
ncbi:GntR family transcriptional regulator [Roseomonas gilardii subsp. gilardii]|uniref:GntR family transcriptional regulator n=1 Tax=Roseomonas gilardii TaxID=257708 RepID=UPI001FF9E5E8|nr:GntR family transcriptional regulator [Roseomonas gilardii]UPG73449.1 GntR family transcriptional regulator [Roseomonas gilardii subsp. gilardii]